MQIFTPPGVELKYYPYPKGGLDFQKVAVFQKNRIKRRNNNFQWRNLINTDT